MTHKIRNYIVTNDYLTRYQDASLSNSRSLLREAVLLFKNGYHARAYFLACASIEETGKAYNAFSARGRNLNNPAVQKKVKESFEDHASKMVSAMVCMARKAAFDSEKVQYLVDLSVHLLHGREKSMYVDVAEDNTITLPGQVVRKKAAFDAVRLAEDCLNTTSHYVKTHEPDTFQTHHDKFFVFNKRTLHKMMSNKDFWYYFLDLMRSEKTQDISYAAAKYHDEYFSKKKTFLKDQSNKS